MISYEKTRRLRRRHETGLAILQLGAIARGREGEEETKKICRLERSVMECHSPSSRFIQKGKKLIFLLFQREYPRTYERRIVYTARAFSGISLNCN